MKKNEKKQKKSEKFILTASCEQLSGGSAFSEGVTGVIDEGDTGVMGEGYREYGDTRGYIVGDNIRF